MGWKIDPTNTEYKYFRLSIASDKMRKGSFTNLNENKSFLGNSLLYMFQLKYYRTIASTL